MTEKEIQDKINEIKAQLREAESIDELTNLAMRLKGWESQLAKINVK
jgi:ppGpp synthetase/RelA/SpoT-type nucleotidyltranferase